MGREHLFEYLISIFQKMLTQGCLHEGKYINARKLRLKKGGQCLLKGGVVSSTYGNTFTISMHTLTI